MHHPTRPGLAATAAAILAIGIGLTACGADDQPQPSAGTPSTTASAGGPTTGPTPNGSGTGAGEPGGTGSNEPGQPVEPTGRPPRIMSPDVQAYVDGGDLVAEVFGHAYDDDGPDPQLRAARVEVLWGDGSTTVAQIDAYSAFRDRHEYDSSYKGRTVTLQIVVYGHDGQTATETIPVDLPK